MWIAAFQVVPAADKAVAGGSRFGCVFVWHKEWQRGPPRFHPLVTQFRGLSVSFNRQRGQMRLRFCGWQGVPVGGAAFLPLVTRVCPIQSGKHHHKKNQSWPVWNSASAHHLWKEILHLVSGDLCWTGWTGHRLAGCLEQPCG